MEETKLEICRQVQSGGVGIRNPVCTGRILALTFLCFKGHIVFGTTIYFFPPRRLLIMPLCTQWELDYRMLLD